MRIIGTSSYKGKTINVLFSDLTSKYSNSLPNFGRLVLNQEIKSPDNLLLNHFHLLSRGSGAGLQKVMVKASLGENLNKAEGSQINNHSKSQRATEKGLEGAEADSGGSDNSGGGKNVANRKKTLEPPDDDDQGENSNNASNSHLPIIPNLGDGKSEVNSTENILVDDPWFTPEPFPNRVVEDEIISAPASSEKTFPELMKQVQELQKRLNQDIQNIEMSISCLAEQIVQSNNSLFEMQNLALPENEEQEAIQSLQNRLVGMRQDLKNELDAHNQIISQVEAIAAASEKGSAQEIIQSIIRTENVIKSCQMKSRSSSSVSLNPEQQKQLTDYLNTREEIQSLQSTVQQLEELLGDTESEKRKLEPELLQNLKVEAEFLINRKVESARGIISAAPNVFTEEFMNAMPLLEKINGEPEARILENSSPRARLIEQNITFEDIQMTAESLLKEEKAQNNLLAENAEPQNIESSETTTKNKKLLQSANQFKDVSKSDLKYAIRYYLDQLGVNSAETKKSSNETIEKEENKQEKNSEKSAVMMSLLNATIQLASRGEVPPHLELNTPEQVKEWTQSLIELTNYGDMGGGIQSLDELKERGVEDKLINAMNYALTANKNSKEAKEGLEALKDLYPSQKEIINEVITKMKIAGIGVAREKLLNPRKLTFEQQDEIFTDITDNLLSGDTEKVSEMVRQLMQHFRGEQIIPGMTGKFALSLVQEAFALYRDNNEVLPAIIDSAYGIGAMVRRPNDINRHKNAVEDKKPFLQEVLSLINSGYTKWEPATISEFAEKAKNIKQLTQSLTQILISEKNNDELKEEFENIIQKYPHKASAISSIMSEIESGGLGLETNAFNKLLEESQAVNRLVEAIESHKKHEEILENFQNINFNYRSDSEMQSIISKMSDEMKRSGLEAAGNLLVNFQKDSGSTFFRQIGENLLSSDKSSQVEKIIEQIEGYIDGKPIDNDSLNLLCIETKAKLAKELYHKYEECAETLRSLDVKLHRAISQEDDSFIFQAINQITRTMQSIEGAGFKYSRQFRDNLHEVKKNKEKEVIEYLMRDKNPELITERDIPEKLINIDKRSNVSSNQQTATSIDNNQTEFDSVIGTINQNEEISEDSQSRLRNDNVSLALRSLSQEEAMSKLTNNEVLSEAEQGILANHFADTLSEFMKENYIDDIDKANSDMILNYAAQKDEEGNLINSDFAHKLYGALQQRNIDVFLKKPGNASQENSTEAEISADQQVIVTPPSQNEGIQETSEAKQALEIPSEEVADLKIVKEGFIEPVEEIEDEFSGLEPIEEIKDDFLSGIEPVEEIEESASIEEEKSVKYLPVIEQQNS